MKSFQRVMTGLLVGLMVSIAVAAPASAQEVPTGAARIIEKVQLRIFISKASLLSDLGQIQENAEAAFANK